jgi:uncharacterized protein DUF6188
VCVGAHDLQLHFDEGVSVSVESVVTCVTADGEEIRYEDLIKTAPCPLSFLHRTIVFAYATRDGTLQLEFDGKRRVSIYDSNERYESYVIKYKDGSIVV